MRSVLLIVSLTLVSAVCHGEEHWAYLPPAMPQALQNAEGNPIDTLLSAAWKKSNIHPAKLAPPKLWMERAAYTLTGLPATRDQIRRIENDPSDKAWATLIDELLASPAYGERWARHWMDVARYADTMGYNFNRDNRYPFAYTYRDWLINAFNRDLPYPDFIKLQLAADLITDRPDHPDLAALGFLTVGPRMGNLEMTDDRVDVVTRGFLSSTVACARCHKHKFDPITMDDYYSLFSILENTTEPEVKPVIGEPADQAAFQDYQVKVAELEATRLKFRQDIATHLHDPSSLATYLDLAQLALTENWDHGRAMAEAFKRGRFRAKAVMKWKEFLATQISDPRLARWNEEMKNAASDQRLALSSALADEWLAAPDSSTLATFAKNPLCPLSYDAGRVHEFYDTVDEQENAKHRSALAALQIDHPGSPPRAMSLQDRENWAPAKIYNRGDPSNRSEPIVRQWLSFLGGGVFPEGKSPRLSLAEKIADPANPLTARVMVNRVWDWHFGNPFTDPGDFGVQQAPPALLPLLDFLAIRFNESGGSLKDLHRLILTSKAFRLAADGPPANARIDEANSLFWKWNRRRADFETLRDHILADSGALDTSSTGGRSVPIDSENSDTRRSLYAFIDRYALATTFVTFDLPHPDHHAPKRVETTVPQQALYLLNSPLMIRQAEKLAASLELQNLPDDAAKIRFLYQRIYQRAPSENELAAVKQWLSETSPADYAPTLSGYWEIRYARDIGGVLSEESTFPLFQENSWRTGPELATSPIRWLHATPNGGHTADGYSLILRWRSQGAGQVKLNGKITRTQKDGTSLEWKVFHAGKDIATTSLGPNQSTPITSEWLDVSAGDSVDFVLRAPEAVDSCYTSWELKALGRETPDSKPREIGDLKTQFPSTNDPPTQKKPSSPMADLIQMLWASNEFNFVE